MDPETPTGTIQRLLPWFLWLGKILLRRYFKFKVLIIISVLVPPTRCFEDPSRLRKSRQSDGKRRDQRALDLFLRRLLFVCLLSSGNMRRIEKKKKSLVVFCTRFSTDLSQVTPLDSIFYDTLFRRNPVSYSTMVCIYGQHCRQ